MKATAPRCEAMISPKVTWTRSRSSSITVLSAKISPSMRTISSCSSCSGLPTRLHCTASGSSMKRAEWNVIAPGVAHHETIRTFHSARFMEDPLAVQCNLVGNPLHEEQLEIVRRLGDCYALNTVLNEDRDLVCVTF